MVIIKGMLHLTKSHPAGLSTLFFTEMWERFSYYGMRALLVLYLVNALDLPRAEALSIYASYTALVYLTPILGGYIADRWLGARRAVLVGGMIMALGHFAMAVPALLYIALGLLVAGNGFFKPNISTMVGQLYAADDQRRDGGFTLFYMGINLGAFLSPLVCGSLGEKIGWHYGFAAAGIGMLAGLYIFARGQKHFVTALVRRDWLTSLAVAVTVSVLVVALVLVWPQLKPWWQSYSRTVQVLIILSCLVLLSIIPRGLGLLADTRLPLLQWLVVNPRSSVSLQRHEIERMIAIFIIALFVIFFWMGFEQAGGTMNLFADKLTDRDILGWEMPASYFQSVNPLLILLLAPLFAMFWSRLNTSPYALSVVSKQALGMIILGLGFVVLAVAQQRADVLGQVGPAWLVMVYFLFTVGELCLSPIGLSMVTRLAPVQLVAFMMGIWFTAIAIASYLAGTLEQLIAHSGIPLYWFLVGSSFGAGAVLFMLNPLLKRLMHGVN